MQQILFLGSNNYKQVFYPNEYWKRYLKMQDTRKSFSGAALSFSLWEPSHSWDRLTKYQQDPPSIVLSWKHSHRFPTLGLGPAEPWEKHYTRQTQLPSGLRQKHEGGRRPGEFGIERKAQVQLRRATIGSHNRLLPTVAKIVSSAELPIFQEKVDIWNFMSNLVFKRLANTFWTIPNLSAG